MNIRQPTGAPPPPQLSCPACDMTRKHQRGCPYFGLSMDEAHRLHKLRAGTDQEDG